MTNVTRQALAFAFILLLWAPARCIEIVDVRKDARKKDQRSIAAAVEKTAMKLTRAYIAEQYEAFAAGDVTFRMLKRYLAATMEMPEAAFKNGALLGDALDDEVEAITQRCDTGKREMETCVEPTAANRLWELSSATRADAGLDPNGKEAVAMRTRLAEEGAARVSAATKSSVAGADEPRSGARARVKRVAALVVCTVLCVVAVAMGHRALVCTGACGCDARRGSDVPTKRRGAKAKAHRERLRKLADAEARRQTRRKRTN
jgi:hypothetical protein